MKKQVNILVGRHPLVPLIVFAGGGITSFFAIYFTPAPFPLWAAIFALFLLILFFAFLIFCRVEDRAAIGGAGPAAIGPLMAHLYVKFRAPHLEPVLSNGGDTLIQIAFFFGSLFGVAVYIFLMFGEEGGRTQFKAKTCFVLFCLVCSVIMISDLTGKTGIPGPKLPLDIEVPSLTPLTGCRAILVIFSIVVATWPKPVRIVQRT